MLDRLLARRTFLPFLALACLAAYLPAFNNGFIADDYVNLDWAGRFFAHPGFLFTVPPQNFRMTSFVVFEGLKRVFGYRPEVWYAVNTHLSLHCLPALMAATSAAGKRTDGGSGDLVVCRFSSSSGSRDVGIGDE